jgi:hypothetical protein
VSIEQVAGIAVAVFAAAYAAYDVAVARKRGTAGDKCMDECAADALRLAARLRAGGCPEGVAACQALLNVILEHPAHGKQQPPEVKT